jgi:cephalosporin-C deacetylase
MLSDISEARPDRFESTLASPSDFDRFWADTIAETRRYALDVKVTRAETSLTVMDCFDVRFNGWGGHPIAGWLRIPRGSTGALPVVVEFNGYGRGRGFVEQNLMWAASGFAHFEMDTRGQSAAGWRSATPDPVWAEAHMPGMLTKGVTDPRSYYYRRVFADAVRAFDALSHLPSVDPDRAFALGTSQGGGIALAAAGLSDRVRGAVVRVPFLCDIARAVETTETYPYREIADYLRIYRDREREVVETLSYFDGVNHARRASAPALFSVGLMDQVCPPSTVYAAYNAYTGPKEMSVWRYNAHEGGGIDDDLRAIDVLRRWSDGISR